MAAHTREIIDGRDLVILTERELLSPLDARARSLVANASKRVSVVTAISPRAVVDLLVVAIENLRLIRALSQLYGGRPGTLGIFRLVRHVLAHLAVTGGMAAGDSLLQQVLGHGLAAKVSARLGEGVINGPADRAHRRCRHRRLPPRALHRHAAAPGDRFRRQLAQGGRGGGGGRAPSRPLSARPGCQTPGPTGSFGQDVNKIFSARPQTSTCSAIAFLAKLTEAADSAWHFPTRKRLGGGGFPSALSDKYGWLLAFSGVLVPNLPFLALMTFACPKRSGAVVLYLLVAILSRKAPGWATVGLLVLAVCIDTFMVIAGIFDLAPSLLLESVHYAVAFDFFGSAAYMVAVGVLVASTATSAWLLIRFRERMQSVSLLPAILTAFAIFAADIAVNMPSKNIDGLLGSFYSAHVPFTSAMEETGFEQSAVADGHNLLVVVVEGHGRLRDVRASGPADQTAGDEEAGEALRRHVRHVFLCRLDPRARNRASCAAPGAISATISARPTTTAFRPAWSRPAMRPAPSTPSRATSSSATRGIRMSASSTTTSWKTWSPTAPTPIPPIAA